MLTGVIAALLAIAVAVVSPAVLNRLAGDGHCPRTALFAWLTVCISVPLTLAIATLLVVFGGPTHDPFRILAHACMRILDDHPLFGVSLMVLLAAALSYLVIVVVRTWWQNREHRDRHLELLSLVKVHHPQEADFAVVESTEPAVYCVPGRPGMVTISTAALTALDRDELAAVLSHERAHLAGHHHAVLTALRGLRHAMPFLPFARGAEVAVGRLLEMRADDVAVREHGVAPLASALVLLSGRAAPAPSLGVAGPGAVARLLRLLQPASTRKRLSSLVGTATCALVLGGGPPLVLIGPSVMMAIFGWCPMDLIASAAVH